MPELRVIFRVTVSERDLGRLSPAEIICENMAQILDTLQST